MGNRGQDDVTCPRRGGYTVREVIDTVERVTGRRVPVWVVARRAGDPAVLVANSNRIRSALEVRPVPPSSLVDVNGAIAAIDNALHFIDHHFSKRTPTMYEHLDIRGGSKSLIWIVRRGLAARDEDSEQHRPAMRFPD